MIVLIFLGCTSGDVSDLSSSRKTMEVPPYTYEISQYKEQINTVWNLGLPDPEEAKQAYLEWRLNGDAFCPGQGFQLQGIIEPCTSSLDYTFSGMATIMGAITELSFPDEFEVGADCYILDPQDNRFVGAGDLIYESTGDGTNGQIDYSITGTWESPHHDGWLGNDNSFWLTQSINWNGSETWSITINGGHHINDISLQYTELTIGSECHGGSGTIAIRDPNSYWLHLELEDNCSGCGNVVYNDQIQGELCLDLYDIAMSEFQQQQVY
jgi:hypothetical protein